MRLTLKPLSVALRLPLEDLSTQFESAFPVALRLQQHYGGIGQLWAEVLRDAGRRVVNLGAFQKVVVFMLAAFGGTGEVENNFSIVQGISSHRRAGVSVEVLRACVKVALA